MWNYINKEFNIQLPRYSICPDHQAPLDFVYHAFMATYDIILAMANRSGGKTLAMALISVLEARANDNCEIANLGAIQAQAQRCYRYMQNFIEMNPNFSSFTKGESTMNRTQFINNSQIEVLTATITGVNSPHPQRLKMDEIELIAWFIIQQALNMVQGRGDVKACTIMGSTRKFAAGPMQRLVDMSTTGQLKLFAWCIWEVMEKLPEDQQEREKIFSFFKNKGFELPERTDLFNGYYKWKDLMAKVALLDLEIWEAEWLCKRPQTGGLVYPRFDETLNTIRDFELDRQALELGNKQIYLFEDYGYAQDHPDVVLFAYVDIAKEEVIIFDELYSVKKGTQEIIDDVITKLGDHGLTLQDVSGWIADPHGLTEWVDRFNKGMPMLGDYDNVGKLGENAQLYKIKNRIPLVRKFVDDRKLKFTTNIVGLREEMLSYSKRKLPDGRFTDDPEKKNDHGPDALGYGLIGLFPALAYGAFGQDTPEEEKEKLEYTPITSGLMNKTF